MGRILPQTIIRLLLFIVLLLPAISQADVYSFQTDSTNEGNFGAWRNRDITILSNYESGSSAGKLDSLMVKAYVNVEGSDSLRPVIYSSRTSLLEVGDVMVLASGTGGQDVVLYFDGTTDIAANTRYWVGVSTAWTGTAGLYTSAQNAADSFYSSQNTDPVPLTDMQANWYYLNSTDAERFPLKMNVWYSADKQVRSGSVCATGGNWIDCDSTYSSDNQRADNGTAGNSNLIDSAFGFSIPTGATIDSLKVITEGYYSGAGGADRPLAIQFLKDGTLHGDIVSYNLTVDTDVTTTSVGTTNDVWGGTWTAADINKGTFGVALNRGTVDFSTYRIDHVQILVGYTEAAGGTGQMIMIEASQ